MMHCFWDFQRSRIILYTLSEFISTVSDTCKYVKLFAGRKYRCSLLPSCISSESFNSDFAIKLLSMSFGACSVNITYRTVRKVHWWLLDEALALKAFNRFTTFSITSYVGIWRIYFSYLCGQGCSDILTRCLGEGGGRGTNHAVRNQFRFIARPLHWTLIASPAASGPETGLYKAVGNIYIISHVPRKVRLSF